MSKFEIAMSVTLTEVDDKGNRTVFVNQDTTWENMDYPNALDLEKSYLMWLQSLTETLGAV